MKYNEIIRKIIENNSDNSGREMSPQLPAPLSYLLDYVS